MLCNSKNNTRLDLYLIAGVNTAPHFMEEFRQTLHREMEEAGAEVRSKLLFPYGDWSRRTAAQLLEIRRDMRLPPERLNRSIGGRQVLEAMWPARGEDGRRSRPILIGHSGGGVAAVHASALLPELEGGVPCPVVMIGSPKCRIPDAMRGSVLYLRAAGRGRRRGTMATADPVARIGSFGGWSPAGRFGWPKWRRDKHAPTAIRSVPILGGHADYFRNRHPYLDEAGKSNLERISETVREWLAERLRAPEGADRTGAAPESGGDGST